MEIKDIQGNILIDALVTEQAVKVDELMKQHSITLSWVSVTDEQLPLGVYIEYEGVRYSLLAPYNPEQSDEATYAYNPVFEHPIMRWQHIPFFFYTYSEGKVISKELDWSLTDNPANFMKAVCDAILNETGEDWSYEISADLPASASQSFSNTDIFSTLNAIAGAFETEWWFDYANKIVYLSKAAYGDAVTLEVGQNIGVPSKNQSEEGYYTRFYAFGSTRNIEQSYAGSNVNSIVNRRLTLNPEKYPNGYIDIREGLTESEILIKTLVFDEIYPRSSLTISDVKVRLMWRLDDSGEKVQIGTDSEGNPVYDQYAIWYFKIPGLSFSKDMLIEGKALSVHFNSGPLNGREFELTYHDTAKEVTTSDGTSIQVEVGDYEINFIEEGSYIIPAITGLVPMDGDAVTLFNIVMPEEYKVSAYEELEQEVGKEIAKQGEDKNNYTFDSNKVAFFENNPNLAVGRAVTYKNGDYTLTTRVIKLETRLDYPFEQRITIGNAQIKGTQQTLKEEVVNANQNIDLLAAINENTEAFQQSLQRTQKAVLDSLAKWGDMWTYDAKNKAVRSKYNIISDLDVISGGDPDTEGEESKASVVVFTPILTSGKEIAKIQIDGVVQSIYAPESYEVDLSGYATENYVNTAIQNAKDTRVDELINTTIPGLSGEINSLRTDFNALNTLLNDDVSGKINTWNEVVDFLDEYSGSQDLATILSGMNADIAKRALQTSLDATNTNLTNVSNRVKTLEDMFEWDGDTIKAKASFYSIDEVSSFGLVAEGDGTGGVTALAALDDVNVSNPTDGQSLVYDLASDKWVNKTVSGGISQVTIKLGTTSYDSVNGVVALPAYPTTLKNPYTLTWSGHSNGSYDGSSAVNIAIPTSLPASDVYDWAKAASKPSYAFSEITGKPTTLAGYGITDTFFLHTTTNYIGVRFANGEYATGDKYLEWWNGAGWVNHMSAKYIVVGGTSSHFLKGDGSLDSTTYLPLSGGTMGNNAGISWTYDVHSWDAPVNGLECITTSNSTLGYYSGLSYKGYYGLQIRAYGGNTDLIQVRGFNHANWGTWREVIHSGNIGSYNAGSATKLQTTRNIWGRDFDGTANVSGNLYITNNNFIRCYDTEGDYRSVLGINNSNILQIGYESSAKEYKTFIYGNEIVLSYGASHNQALTINSSGNVLIGTTTDNGSKLSVNGDIRVDGTSQALHWDAVKLYSNGSWSTVPGYVVGIGAYDGNGLVGRFGITFGNGLGRFTVRGLYNSGGYNSSGEVFIVRGDGRVGVNTTSPAYTLDVAGTLRATGRIHANEWIQIESSYGLYFPSTGFGTAGYIVPNTISTYGGFAVYGKKSNYHGIHIGDTKAGITLMHTGEYGGLYREGRGAWLFFANNYNEITIGDDAKVPSTGYKLWVSGNTYVAGDFVATGEVSSGSDARYKAIQSYVDIDIETIASAPIINFKWNDREDDKVHLGSTAQYWYSTSLCNGVTPTDDEKLWTMGYGQIALASVVSVAKKVVNHEDRIAALEKENKELKLKLERYGIQ